MQMIYCKHYELFALLKICFFLFLTGHGRRIRFRDNDEKNSAIEAFLASKEHLHDNSNNRNKEPLFA